MEILLLCVVCPRLWRASYAYIQMIGSLTTGCTSVLGKDGVLEVWRIEHVPTDPRARRSHRHMDRPLPLASRSMAIQRTLLGAVVGWGVGTGDVDTMTLVDGTLQIRAGCHGEALAGWLAGWRAGGLAGWRAG